MPSKQVFWITKTQLDYFIRQRTVKEEIIQSLNDDRLANSKRCKLKTMQTKKNRHLKFSV